MASGKDSFIKSLIRKISANKDIICTTISFGILAQTMFFSLLDEDLQNIFKNNYMFLMLFVVIILLVFFGGMLLNLYYDQQRKTISQLKTLETLKCSKREIAIPKTAEYMEKMQLYLITDIEKIENSIQNDDQIWVLTSDVKLETSTNTISETMENNLKKGVSYIYFIPDTIKNSASIMELERKYKKYPTFTIIKIESNYKLLFEQFDVIIYSPDTNKRSSFICVNFSDNYNTIAFKKFSDDDTRIIIGLLQNIWRS